MLTQTPNCSGANVFKLPCSVRRNGPRKLGESDWCGDDHIANFTLFLVNKRLTLIHMSTGSFELLNASNRHWAGLCQTGKERLIKIFSLMRRYSTDELTHVTAFKSTMQNKCDTPMRLGHLSLPPSSQKAALNSARSANSAGRLK